MPAGDEPANGCNSLTTGERERFAELRENVERRLKKLANVIWSKTDNRIALSNCLASNLQF